MQIGDKQIGADKLFFMIEEGQANLGDFTRALAMVDVVAKTGADAIEFQLARAGDFYVKSNPGYVLYLGREFSDEQHRDLIAAAQNKGLGFIATTLSHKLVEPLAKAGCSGFNINASDLTNPDMIDAVRDSGLPFFLSLPLANVTEVEWALNRIRTLGKAEFALLHGQHTMASGEHGVEIEHTSLGYLSAIKEQYALPAGYIDHTSAIWGPAAAVAAGADIVSKHIALSRAEKGPDWHVCLEPEEMKQAVGLAVKMKESMNIKNKVLAPGEMIDRSIMRRSIVAAKKIPKGKAIERSDLEFKRPGTGLEPLRFMELIGRIALQDINCDEEIKPSDLRSK
ncbi:MAG: N-acetylneuraminate synthase family protein [bacterium]